MQPRNSKWPVEILIVDDELQAVKYFYKAFSDKYDIVTATSADEAEDIIFSGKHDIGVVITDQRMPGRSGINLLSSIRKRRPEIVRMLASAYCDLDSAIHAVNCCEIFRYISKPWDLTSLEIDLERAVTFHILQQENEALLREKLGAVQRNVLRERMNGMASMSVMLTGYKNASSTMYDYLKDMMAETAWRSEVKRQWEAMPVNQHWQLPVTETQRHIALATQLMEPSLTAASNDDATSDAVAVVADCAQSLRTAHDVMSITIAPGSERALVPADATLLKGIVTRLMQSVSHWSQANGTVLVRVSEADAHTAPAGTIIEFEMRSFDAAKAAGDCVLHIPPHATTPKQAIEFLRAALALGHLGGRISAPPAKNGFKHVEVYLPSVSGRSGNLATPSDWLHDLNEEFDRWSIGLYDLAS